MAAKFETLEIFERMKVQINPDDQEEVGSEFEIERLPKTGEIIAVFFRGGLGTNEARVDEELVRAVGAWLMDERRKLGAVMLMAGNPQSVRDVMADMESRVLDLCGQLQAVCTARKLDAERRRAIATEIRDLLDIMLEPEGT